MRRLLIAATLLLTTSSLYAQMELTIEQAIDLSIKQSPDLLRSELNLERYGQLLSAQEASLKSQFSLDVDPIEYSQSRKMDSRLSEWYTNEYITSSSTFSVSQPIVWTGSTIALKNEFGWESNKTTRSSGDNMSESFINTLKLTLDQPLFTFNEMKYELLTIAMDYEDAQISYAMTRLNLEQQITNLFYAAYMAQQNLLIAEEEMVDAQANYDIISEKVNIDLVPRAELFQAELNLSDAASTLETRRMAVETAKDTLKQILGINLSTDIVVVADIMESTIPISLDMAVRNALTNRLELKQRQIANKNADITLMQIKDNNSFQGNIALSVGLTGDNAKIKDLYETPTSSPSVGLSFSIPIFDWGARRDKIRAQQIQIQMNEIDEEQELVDIEMEVLKCFRSLKNLVKQIEIAKNSVKNAQHTYDLNVEKYRAGEITGMEINQFQSQLSSKKIGLSQKMVDYKLELINLKCTTLYDFEDDKPISPMLMYSTESMTKFQKYKKRFSK